MTRVALCVALVASACSCVSMRGPADLRRDVVRETGWRLERETAFGIGRLPLRLVDSLDGLSRVEVGIYQLDEANHARSLRGLEVRGMQPIVRVRESGSETSILVDDELTRELVVISRDSREVVIVRMRGDVERFLLDILESVGEENKGWNEAARIATHM